MVVILGLKTLESSLGSSLCLEEIDGGSWGTTGTRVGEQMLMLFHRRVTSLVRNTDDLRATYHALALIDAARQSAEEGRRLDLDS